MISIEKALRHMAWSNQLIFQELSKLPEDIYGIKAAEGEWPIGRIITHFIAAAEWYRYCSTGITQDEIIPITNHQLLNSQAPRLAKLDEVLIAQAARQDEICIYKDGDNEFKSPLSTILAQAVNHTAEHKGQLSTLLKVHGHFLDLDDKDVWAYESKTK